MKKTHRRNQATLLRICHIRIRQRHNNHVQFCTFKQGASAIAGLKRALLGLSPQEARRTNDRDLFKEELFYRLQIWMIIKDWPEQDLMYVARWVHAGFSKTPRNSLAHELLNVARTPQQWQMVFAVVLRTVEEKCQRNVSTVPPVTPYTLYRLPPPRCDPDRRIGEKMKPRTAC